MKNTKLNLEKLDNLGAYTKNHPIRNKEYMILGITCNRIDQDHMDRVKNFLWSKDYLSNNNKYKNSIQEKNFNLIKKILTFGGEEVCMPHIDQFVEDEYNEMLERGQLWYGDRIKMLKGEPHRCHSNSAELWVANKNNPDEKVLLATGYALSKDGLWRQHSWLVRIKPRANQIIETTEKRIAYFGYLLNEEESEKFVYEND
jgi:hypothetical protein